MSKHCEASSSTPASSPLSPLAFLHDRILSIFQDGRKRSAGKFLALRQLVLDGTDPVLDFDANLQAIGTGRIGWNVCELVAGTVMVVASPCDRRQNKQALRFASRILGGLPTMRTVGTVPSADLGEYFRVAKKAAIDGHVGKLTVLGVNLVDVGMLERKQAGKDLGYTSFEHTFVLGIGREGFRMWSAWARCDYQLDDLAKPTGARLRDWDEGKELLKFFKILTTGKGTWSEEINKAYATLFEVDLLEIRGKDKQCLPIVPEYKSWVRIFEINDVQTTNFEKLKCYPLGPRLRRSCEDMGAHSIVTNGKFHGEI
ncbi:hypothetical protein MMC26_001238 [Xylographa opegraphella]|nr:hypothetical protein [Xylographa opegraphella]